MITIDHEKCTLCGRCAAVCPAMVMERSGGRMEYAHKNVCILCYHCVAVCPEGAVSCEEFGLDAFRAIDRLKPATPAAARSLMLRRRSVREFKNKEVPRKLLEELAEAAAHAPTGHNAQSVQLSIISDTKVINKVDRRITKTFCSIVEFLDNPVAEGVIKAVGGRGGAEKFDGARGLVQRFETAGAPRNMQVFRGAPAVIIAHTPPGAAGSPPHDCTIALCHAMLLANAHGLGATWIGFIVSATRIDPTLKRPLGVPLRNTIHAAMILGWPKYTYKRMIPRKELKTTWITGENK